jgi:SAM-dependent methyltransferase
MKEILKNIYKHTFKRVFPSAGEISDNFLINELKDCASILDLGCGPHSPLGRIKNKLKPNLYSVGVDDFDPYLDGNKKNKIHSKYIKSNIFNISFPEKSFDCAILLDVIEHFEKDDFLKFISKLEKITKKIIIFTPNGFIKQDKYDGNDYQIHKSGWTVEDMTELGFKSLGVCGLKSLRGELAVTKIRPIFLGNMISNITEPMVYNKPESAFSLMCVKNIK